MKSLNPILRLMKAGQVLTFEGVEDRNLTGTRIAGITCTTEKGVYLNSRYETSRCVKVTCLTPALPKKKAGRKTSVCEGCGDPECSVKQSDCDGERHSDLDPCTCYQCGKVSDNDNDGEWAGTNMFICDDCSGEGT